MSVQMIYLIICSLVWITTVKHSYADFTIPDGQWLILNCSLPAIHGDLCWTVDDSPCLPHSTKSPSINVTFVGDYKIRIDNVKENQAQGVFNISCYHNQTILNDTFQVTLLKAPRISTKSSQSTVVTHSQLSVILYIPCNSSGFPKPSITWEFDDVQLNVNNGPIKEEIKGIDEEYFPIYEVFTNGTLLINKPASDDYNIDGYFTCIASNSGGNDSVTHQLFVGNLKSYTFQVALNDNEFLLGNGMMSKKFDDEFLTGLNIYDVNITMIEEQTIHFTLRWEAKNQTKAVEEIAQDVWTVLDNNFNAVSFIMNGAPAPPTNLKLDEEGKDEITFSWDHPQYFIVDEYQIQSFDNKVWRNHDLIKGDLKTYTLTNLDSDTKYLIRMFGVRLDERGKHSTVLKAKTSASAPVTIIVAVVVIVLVVVIGSILGVIYYRKTPSYHAQLQENPYAHSLPGIQVSNIYMENERVFCPYEDTQSPSSEQPSYFSWLEIPRDCLTLGGELGSGEFGLVQKAEWKKGDGTETTVAVKSIKGHATELDKVELFKELKLMADVSLHRNIVNLIGACSKEGPLYIVVEFCENGQLLKYLRDGKNRYKNSKNEFVSKVDLITRTKLAFDVASGMSHLEAKKLAHRDLAARNVLLGKNFVAKVSDFGLSRDIYERGWYQKTTEGKLPVKWMAIESLLESVYSSKSDVWSFGILLWEIDAAGISPYPGIGGRELLNHLRCGVRLGKPEVTTPEIYELMQSCWEDTPEDRPTFSELQSTISVYLEAISGYLPVVIDETSVPAEENAYLNQGVHVDDERVDTTSC